MRIYGDFLERRRNENTPAFSFSLSVYLFRRYFTSKLLFKLVILGHINCCMEYSTKSYHE